MLRKTLTNVVLPLNAIAAEIVAVGPCLSPLYTAHLWHFDQTPGLRNQTLRCSTAASSNRDFWFDHALEMQNICSNQSNADCQWQCRYKLTAGIKWYWLWSLSRCSGFTLHHWPSWQHMSQCWTGFLLTWTAPHWVQGMPLRLQKRKIHHAKESCNLINTITPLLHRFYNMDQRQNTVNDDRMFIFWWTVHLNEWKRLFAECRPKLIALYFNPMFQDGHLLDWSNLGLLDNPWIILLRNGYLYISQSTLYCIFVHFSINIVIKSDIMSYIMITFWS